MIGLDVKLMLDQFPDALAASLDGEHRIGTQTAYVLPQVSGDPMRLSPPPTSSSRRVSCGWLGERVIRLGDVEREIG